MSLKVLFVHNAYQQRGGEDSVVEAEVALLQSKGHEVRQYNRNNNELKGASKLGAMADAFWSTRTTADMQHLLQAERPDVVHVHNTFPLISPSLYWAAHTAGVPVVQTLHNFRLLCPQAMFLREGKVCEDCLGKVPWRGAMRGCYRGSKLQSIALAGMVTTHRALGTWQNKVTRYIALNEFCRNKFIEGGLPAERIVVKPNFVDFSVPPDSSRNGFLFVGRLSEEKGINILVEAAKRQPTVFLRVAGAGPEEHLLDSVPNLAPLGGLNMAGVRTEMCQASALVVPSIWYENFPRTIVEAFACGLPVIASRIGALAEIVQDGVTGLLFNPGDAADLAEKLNWAEQHPQEMARMGHSARRQYELEFSPEVNYQRLMAIYQEAMSATQQEPL